MKKLIVITAVGMYLCGSADSQRVVCIHYDPMLLHRPARRTSCRPA